MKGPFDTQISVYRILGGVTSIPCGTPQAHCNEDSRNALMSRPTFLSSLRD